MTKELLLTEESRNMYIVEGKFNLVVSNYQSGKTTVLTNIASNYIKKEKNVIYYGLDSSDEYMKKRIYSILSNKPLNDIKQNKFGFYEIKDDPTNIIFNSNGLDDITLGFDIELCGNAELLFIDTINSFNILGSATNNFDERLKKQIVFFNSICDKYNVTIVASLNTLKVQTFDIEKWKKLILGNILIADNQYVNFKIFDVLANKTRDYGIINSSMRLTCEIEERTTDKKCKSLIIPSTGFTPDINFDVDTNIFKIKGRSYPTHSEQFWKPIVEWFKSVCENRPTNISVEINLDFINSSSEKYIMEIVKAVKPIGSSIKWFYDSDDEDMVEFGAELCKLTGVSFIFIQNRYSDADVFD